jgi:CubicO group peptidase (beta-lactamase class C family)
MKKKKRIVQTLRIIMPIMAITCAIIFPPWDLVGAWLAPLPDTVQEQLDDAVKGGFDGIIVYVNQTGHPPALYASGWKNREHQVPADPHALFKIASISKLYVATAITKLVNQERLSLDDTLAHHFPELVGRIENADSITLKMMLKHRSGIPNLTDHPDFPWTDPPKTSQASLEYALDLPADFDPDKKYSYSNTNYLLLSELIDRVVGYSHFQFMQEEILIPLGLTNTFSSIREVDPADLMSGYFVDYDLDIKQNYFGSMVATAEDVGLFLRALNDGSLLTADEQAIYSSVYEYEHTGLLPGYQSIAQYHKNIDAVVVQFVNTSGGNSWTMSEIVYRRIVKILRKASSP